MRSFSSCFTALSAAALFLTPAFAHAHTGLGAHGAAQGFAHPLSGRDHLLAMIAVGLWASQLGGKAVWRVPAAFVAAMAAGGVLGQLGMRVPLVEIGVAASVLLLGALVLSAKRLSVSAGMGLASVFAVFHGYAHGAEMPADVSGLTYALGFLTATVLLHAVGVGLGRAAQLTEQKRAARLPLLRMAGAGVMLSGVFLLLNR